MKSLIFDLDDTLLMSGTYKNYNDIVPNQKLKNIFENLQNPKSNRISKPGFTYSEDFINVSPHIGYDSPSMQKDKAALKEK